MTDDPDEQDRAMAPARAAEYVLGPKGQDLAKKIYALIDESGLSADDTAIVLNQVLTRVEGNDGGQPRKPGENL